MQDRVKGGVGGVFESSITTWQSSYCGRVCYGLKWILLLALQALISPTSHVELKRAQTSYVIPLIFSRYFSGSTRDTRPFELHTLRSPLDCQFRTVSRATLPFSSVNTRGCASKGSQRGDSPTIQTRRYTYWGKRRFGGQVTPPHSCVHIDVEPCLGAAQGRQAQYNTRPCLLQLLKGSLSDGTPNQERTSCKATPSNPDP